jgi:uncharacterized membrane protein
VHVAKEFINPNWHVILIHYPLGLFVLGMLIELFSFLYRRSTLRTAGRWMILLGALSGIPAALSGIYAMGNVVRMELPESAVTPEQPWKQVWQTSEFGKTNPEQREFLGRHVWAQSSATALAVVLVTIAIGCSDPWRKRLYFPLLLGLLFSLAAMVWGAYFGGEMVYRHGTGVLRVQAKGTMPEASEPKPTESAADEQVEAKRNIEYYVPPLQLHVVLAGLAVAVAFGALGLSMRAVAVAGEGPRERRDDLDDVAERDLLYAPPVPRGPAAMDVARSLNPDAGVDTRPPRLPVSRLWLLTTVIGLAAMAAGWWLLGGTDEVRTWEPKRLWSMVAPTRDHPVTRRFVHVVTGGVIIVVPLLLALVTRVSRRPKVTLTLLGLLLVLAVALQVWLGVLLMLDTPNGSIYRFNDPTSATTSPAPATSPTTQGIASR